MPRGPAEWWLRGVCKIMKDKVNLKIISGAQTGADVAGLWAAKLFNISTGGWAPKGFMTLNGPHPEMAETFGIKEHIKAGYHDRTIANIQDANMTIVCSEKMSAGTKLTINQCKKENKTCVFFKLYPEDISYSLDTANFDKIILNFNNLNLLNLPFTINIAGNSTKNSARSFEFTFKLCYKLFYEIGFTTELDINDWKKYKDTYKGGI